MKQEKPYSYNNLFSPINSKIKYINSINGAEEIYKRNLIKESITGACKTTEKTGNYNNDKCKKYNTQNNIFFSSNLKESTSRPQSKTKHPYNNFSFINNNNTTDETNYNCSNLSNDNKNNYSYIYSQSKCNGSHTKNNRKNSGRKRNYTNIRIENTENKENRRRYGSRSPDVKSGCCGNMEDIRNVRKNYFNNYQINSSINQREATSTKQLNSKFNSNKKLMDISNISKISRDSNNKTYINYSSISPYWNKRELSKREKLEKMKNDMILKEKRQLQDKPKISKSSKIIAERLLSNNGENVDSNVFERLSNVKIMSSKDKLLEKQLEINEGSHVPNINIESKRLKRTINDLYNWQNRKERKMHETCEFFNNKNNVQFKIDQNSENILNERNPGYCNKKVEDRLIEQGRRNEIKNKKERERTFNDICKPRNKTINPMYSNVNSRYLEDVSKRKSDVKINKSSDKIRTERNNGRRINSQSAFNTFHNQSTNHIKRTYTTTTSQIQEQNNQITKQRDMDFEKPRQYFLNHNNIYNEHINKINTRKINFYCGNNQFVRDETLNNNNNNQLSNRLSDFGIKTDYSANKYNRTINSNPTPPSQPLSPSTQELQNIRCPLNDFYMNKSSAKVSPQNYIDTQSKVLKNKSNGGLVLNDNANEIINKIDASLENLIIKNNNMEMVKENRSGDKGDEGGCEGYNNGESDDFGDGEYEIWENKENCENKMSNQNKCYDGSGRIKENKYISDNNISKGKVDRNYRFNYNDYLNQQNEKNKLQNYNINNNTTDTDFINTNKSKYNCTFNFQRNSGQFNIESLNRKKEELLNMMNFTRSNKLSSVNKNNINVNDMKLSDERRNYLINKINNQL